MDDPELTDEDREAMDSFPDDAVDHWWRGERWIRDDRIRDAAKEIVEHLADMGEEAAAAGHARAKDHWDDLIDRIAAVIADKIGADAPNHGLGGEEG